MSKTAVLHEVSKQLDEALRTVEILRNEVKKLLEAEQSVNGTAFEATKTKIPDILRKAYLDVVELERLIVLSNLDFHVNEDKGVVVAVLTGLFSGNVVRKGIARTAPEDTFYVEIGKAIALRRALGLEIPEYYLNLPQGGK